MMCQTTWQTDLVKTHKCSLTHKHGMMLSPSTVTANIAAETDRLIESCGAACGEKQDAELQFDGV